MSDDLCQCGHARMDHKYRGDHRSQCQKIVNERTWLDFDSCSCKQFDNSVLPAPGERLEFGRHRQPEDAAETAPAWGSTEALGRALARQADKKADAAMDAK